MEREVAHNLSVAKIPAPMSCTLAGALGKGGPPATLRLLVEIQVGSDLHNEITWRVNLELVAGENSLVVETDKNWSADSLWSIKRFGACVYEVGLRRDLITEIEFPSLEASVPHDALLAFYEDLLSASCIITADRFSETCFIVLILPDDRNEECASVSSIVASPDDFVKFGRAVVQMFDKLNNVSGQLALDSTFGTLD